MDTIDNGNNNPSGAYTGEAADFIRRAQQRAQQRVTDANHAAQVQRQNAQQRAHDRRGEAHQQADGILGQNLQQVFVGNGTEVTGIDAMGRISRRFPTGTGVSGTAVDAAQDRVYWAEVVSEAFLVSAIGSADLSAAVGTPLVSAAPRPDNIVIAPIPIPIPDTGLREGQVALYEHANYGGRMFLFTADNANFLNISGLNDQISSLRVGPNTTAVLFEHINFQGRQQRFSVDTPWLGGLTIGNDSASSLRIERTTPPITNLQPGQVALYEHANYQGRVWTLDREVADFRTIANLNDQISSLRVGPNTIVTLHDAISFTGRQQIFGTDTPWLGVTLVGNDTASSLRIRTTTQSVGQLQVGQIALYEHANFGGRVWLLDEDIPDFRTFANLNDQISSLRVGPNTRATLFSNINFGGQQQVFAADNPWLGPTQIGNDTASSLQIRVGVGDPNNLQTGQVALYEDFNYGGRVWSFDVEVPDFRTVPGLNDLISSVRVGSNTRATLFSNINFGGQQQSFSVDTPSLGGSVIGNDMASSLRISTVVPEPPTRGRLQSAGVDGSDQQTVAEFEFRQRLSRLAGAVALDFANLRFFWIAPDATIYAGGFDGSNPTTVASIAPQSSQPIWSIAVDGVNGMIYVSDGREIRRVSASGGQSTLIATINGATGGIGLAVDGINSALYWNSGQIITRADLNGSSQQQLYTTTERYIGLAFDLPTQLLYWIEDDMLLRGDISGEGLPEVVYSLPANIGGTINSLDLLTAAAAANERLLEANAQRRQAQQQSAQQIQDAHANAIQSRLDAQAGVTNAHTTASQNVANAQQSAQTQRQGAQTQAQRDRQQADQRVNQANQDAETQRRNARSSGDTTRRNARQQADGITGSAQSELDDARRRQQNS